MQVNRALTAAEIATRVARKNATTRDLSNLLWMILDKGIGYDIEQEVRDMLVEARKEAGLSRRQVETRVGVPYANLSEFENGTRVPRLELVAKIAHAYGKRVVVQLVDEEEENASTPQPQLCNDQEVLAAVLESHSCVPTRPYSFRRSAAGLALQRPARTNGTR